MVFYKLILNYFFWVKNNLISHNSCLWLLVVRAGIALMIKLTWANQPMNVSMPKANCSTRARGTRSTGSQVTRFNVSYGQFATGRSFPREQAATVWIYFYLVPFEDLLGSQQSKKSNNHFVYFPLYWLCLSDNTKLR